MICRECVLLDRYRAECLVTKEKRVKYSYPHGHFNMDDRVDTFLYDEPCPCNAERRRLLRAQLQR